MALDGKENIRLPNRTICRKCVLPEAPPDILLDGEGICSICRAYEKDRMISSKGGLLETEFIKILNQNKPRGKYDCLVMCSGGKDSTAALYYMKKRFKRNPLAFTFDHGFETEEALENVRNAVEILNVDFLSFKSDFMKELFAGVLSSGSKAVLCHPCSIWYMELTFEMAARFDIPIIIAGWTKGQSTNQQVMSRCGCNIHEAEFVSMAKATNEFLDVYLKTNPKYDNFPRSMEEVLSRAKKKHKCLVLSPHWFLPDNSDVYVKIIMKELKWKFPSLSYPAYSTNCYLNFISVYNSMKFFGYTHYHVEMSKLIRSGLLSREEALRSLEINFNEELLSFVVGKIGCDVKISDETRC